LAEQVMEAAMVVVWEEEVAMVAVQAFRATKDLVAATRPLMVAVVAEEVHGVDVVVVEELNNVIHLIKNQEIPSSLAHQPLKFHLT